MVRKNPNKLKQEVEKAVREYRETLQSAGLKVDELVVFGSQAKGTAHEWSDIDVAVVSPDFGIDYHQDLIRLMELRDRGFLAIEPHPLTPEDLNNEWDALAREVRKYGIPVE